MIAAVTRGDDGRGYVAGGPTGSAKMLLVRVSLDGRSETVAAGLERVGGLAVRAGTAYFTQRDDDRVWSLDLTTAHARPRQTSMRLELPCTYVEAMWTLPCRLVVLAGDWGVTGDRKLVLVPFPSP